jgi:glycerol-3-phosphate acyltransferase PlsY
MLPVMLLFVLVAPTTPLSYVLYAAVGAGLIWLAHSDNIDRLLHGTERKFDLGLLGGKRSSGG